MGKGQVAERSDVIENREHLFEVCGTEVPDSFIADPVGCAIGHRGDLGDPEGILHSPGFGIRDGHCRDISAELPVLRFEMHFGCDAFHAGRIGGAQVPTHFLGALHQVDVAMTLHVDVHICERYLAEFVHGALEVERVDHGDRTLINGMVVAPHGQAVLCANRRPDGGSKEGRRDHSDCDQETECFHGTWRLLVCLHISI